MNIKVSTYLRVALVVVLVAIVFVCAGCNGVHWPGLGASSVVPIPELEPQAPEKGELHL